MDAFIFYLQCGKYLSLSSNQFGSKFQTAGDFWQYITVLFIYTSTNRLRRQSGPTFGGTQSAAGTYENTQL